jgi:hyperosmotically inducible protein
MKLFSAAAVCCGLVLLPALSVAQDKKSTPSKAELVGREVRHELLMLPNLTLFDDLSYSVGPGPSGGASVTLTGSVTRPVLKSSAENVVKRLESVDNVVNNIEVLPLSPNDDRIRMAVYRKIYGDNVLSTRYGFRAQPTIRIIVKNGNVRLTGVVANEGDKNIAGIRAREAAGTFTVTNDLQINPD